MTVYINMFSMICAAGPNSQKISNNIFSNSYLTPLRKYRDDKFKEFPCFTVDDEVFKQQLPKKYSSRNNQMISYLLSDLIEENLSLFESFSKDQIGVVVGTSTSGIDEGGKAVFSEKLSSYDYRIQELGNPSEYIKDHLGLGSLAMTVSTACSSSNFSLIEGVELIESGICEAAIVGGCDSLSDLTLEGFKSLELLSKKRSCPLSRNRDGINIGEGGGLFFLSKKKIGFPVLGVGATSDAYHLSSPDPSGEGAYQSMLAALEDAGIHSKSVEYINLHGTGTLRNDKMEALAINRLFSHKPLVSSTKSLTGHCLGAAGAIELGLCLLMMDNKYNPQDRGLVHYLEDGEENLEYNLNFFKNEFSKKINISLLNSFAFGGSNSSLIIGRKE